MSKIARIKIYNPGATMTAFHNLLRLFLATSLATLVLPALAGPTPKNYSLLVVDNPAYDTAGAAIAPVPVTVYLKNKAPPGDANSNISSFTLTVTGMTIVNTPATPVSCSIISVSPPVPVPNCALGAQNTIVVKNISPPLQAQQIMAITLGTNSCGDGHWFATVYTGQLSGQNFLLVPDDDFFNVGTTGTPTEAKQVTNTSCGPSGCGTLFQVPTTPTALTQPGYIQVIRSALNKDGTSCNAATDYFVSNMLQASDPLLQGLLHFRWPVSTTEDNPQPSAVFQYTVNLPTKNAQVAWLNGNGSPATDSDPSTVTSGDPLLSPAFIDAPQCLTSALPSLLATLASGIGPDETVIQVTNSLPVGQLPKRPFPAIIGTERILVQQVTGSGTWTIARHQGGTAPSGHSTTDAVMSTPLPILPAAVGPYKSITDPTQPVQAQMCIVSAPKKNSAGFWTATFIDIGDGWGLSR